MIPKLLNWLDDRTGYKGLLNEALYERVPGGARWRYVWGSTLVFTFVLQMLTGVFLWTAYSPSAQTAWESVYFIQEHMLVGDIVRGIHHFAAQAMIVLLAIHLMQVVIDGAYKAPREVNFWLGLVLMQIVLGLSLTGYLLPWDQKGYYATQVSTNIVGATPLIGPQLQQLAQGGPEYGHHTLTRFFAMHAGILPGLLIAFLVLHIYVFRRHGLTVRDPAHRPDTTFWPDQVLKDSVACLAVLAVVLLLAVFKGAELSAPASTDPYAAARPEWYFLFLFRFLRFHAVESIGLEFGAIYVPGAIMGLITLMPIIAWWKGGHRFNVAFLCVLAAGIVGLTGIALYEDARDPAHQAAIAEADRDARRVRELIELALIPPTGAGMLLQNDPFTQGPRLFAQHCKACHRYNGHDGRGRQVMEPDRNDPSHSIQIPAKPAAVDLANFASREWMRAVVVDFSNHFAVWKNANWYHKALEKRAQGDDVDILDPDDSEMADWSRRNRAALISEENRENLDALIEFLVQRAGHSGGDRVDAAKAAMGRRLAVEGGWKGGIEMTCSDCHSTIGDEFVDIPDDEADGYPNLAEYGSEKWLDSFLRNPAATQHYGDRNQMSAYEDRLLDQDLELLVRWLSGNYLPTEIPLPGPVKPEPQ